MGDKPTRLSRPPTTIELLEQMMGRAGSESPTVANATDASRRNLRNSETTARVTLDRALAVFGYSDAVPSHQRYTILSAIALFAASNGQPELGAACETMMTAIKEENGND